MTKFINNLNNGVKHQSPFDQKAREGLNVSLYQCGLELWLINLDNYKTGIYPAFYRAVPVKVFNLF